METTVARLTREDYENAKRLLVQHASARDDIAACWQYGEVSQPGLSDLDVIVVIKDDAKPGVAEHMRKETLPELVRTAMAHANVIVVPESGAAGIFVWDNIQVSDMATGKAVIPPTVDPRFLRLAMLIDWTFERTYRLLRMRQTGLENRRLSLGMLKSYGYCTENFKTLAPERNWSRTDQLKREVQELRNAWVSLSETEQQSRIDSLYAEACDTAISTLRELHGFIDRCGAYPEWTEPAGELDFVFPDGMTLRFVDKLPAQLPSIDGKPVIPVPKRLLHHFAVYLRPDAALSKKLRASFKPSAENLLREGNFQGAYAEFLARRMSYCNGWFDFLKKASFRYGLFKYGWYLNV